MTAVAEAGQHIAQVATPKTAVRKARPLANPLLLDMTTPLLVDAGNPKSSPGETHGRRLKRLASSQ
jgi:hypothetical protein